MTRCKDGLPERSVWLVIKRTLEASPTDASDIRHAPASTPWRLCVWLSGLRWAIEQCCEETKTALGMDHDDVRTYPGWQHHMLLGMLAHGFLWHLKMRLGKNSPRVDGVAMTHGVGGDAAPTPLHGGGCPHACGVETAVHSPGVSVAQKAS